MRKITVRRPGGFSALEMVTTTSPAVAAGSVLVNVHAAGVNFADCIARMGLYASAWHYTGWPMTPGFEVAGIVEAVGADVTNLAVGDRVFAITRFGGYAEKVAVSAAQTFRLPAAISLEQGAALAVIFMSAKYALSELAAPPPESPVLVHSAAGGVGGALVQLGRLNGNFVVAVVGSPGKVEVARRAGADVAIVKSEENWVDAARKAAPAGYRAIFDATGNTLRAGYSLLAPRERLIAYGSHSVIPRSGGLVGIPTAIAKYLALPRYNPLQLVNDNKSVMGFNLSYLFDDIALPGNARLLRDAMSEILGGIGDGKLAIPAITTFALAEAGAAHRELQAGFTTGKLVLTTDAGRRVPTDTR